MKPVHILVVALGADYDYAATPGFEEGGVEYYSVAGAERMRDVVAEFESGRILIGILGHPFKCPPAPFEGAFLLHDHFVERGLREAVEIRTAGPISAPVPVTKEISRSFLDALAERDIEYVANQHIVELDTENNEARLSDGGSMPYELLSRLTLKPGRYELRLAVDASVNQRGSVYTFVDVPDFSEQPLSLSGIVLGATPGPLSAPKDAFAGLLPIVPTARRTFAAADRVHGRDFSAVRPDL